MKTKDFSIPLTQKQAFSGVGVPGSIILSACYGQAFFSEKWLILTGVKGLIKCQGCQTCLLSEELCDPEQVT